LFANRRALSAAGVHRPTMAGIVGTGQTGAESIVLNGGYEDDEDQWDYIVYTGQGGNDPESGRQIADQELTRGNLALARSCDEGLPVRIIRGYKEPSGFGPESGFRYDGVYYVESYWQDRGKSGFLIWRFRLVRDPAASAETPASVQLLLPAAKPTLAASTRRSSLAATATKVLEGYACQVCGVVLHTPSGPYAESVHVRPMGRPHDGADVAENILCLCPNHRVLFERGAVVITAELEVLDTITGEVVGKVRSATNHPISADSLSYHHQLHFIAREASAAG
jgi:putative restriction endonuclease